MNLNLTAFSLVYIIIGLLISVSSFMDGLYLGVLLGCYFLYKGLFNKTCENIRCQNIDNIKK